MSGGSASRFPFGAIASPRALRRPDGDAGLFVLGVYPSALHVRWNPPMWAVAKLGIGPVGALAVADEPTVFWDGADAADEVARWKAEVGFVDGDAPGSWGRVRPAMNGTSGRAVVDKVLTPLGVSPADVWFTDCLDTFFVKAGSASRRQQAEVMRDVYGPFADALGLGRASISARPSASDLIEQAASDHRRRLRTELVQARVPIVVTLGDEAQAVLMAIADAAEGPPTTRLTDTAKIENLYGRPRTATVGDLEMTWYALAHPGNRSNTWAARRQRWAASLSSG